ncbi:MAG: hypothetical protein ACU4EQ_09440 [Candidatus Nitrosoglobus sp.]|jgi:predicted double-glycine peptidase
MHGLKVAFTDPAMGQMRRETAEHKEMEKAFQAEVYSQLREGSKSPSVAPQRSEKRPQGRSNDLI